MPFIHAIQEQLSESRSKEERLEKQLAATRRESKAVQAAVDQLEKSSKDVRRETEHALQAKNSLQVR